MVKHYQMSNNIVFSVNEDASIIRSCEIDAKDRIVSLKDKVKTPCLPNLPNSYLLVPVHPDIVKQDKYVPPYCMGETVK